MKKLFESKLFTACVIVLTMFTFAWGAGLFDRSPQTIWSHWTFKDKVTIDKDNSDAVSIELTNTPTITGAASLTGAIDITTGTLTARHAVWLPDFTDDGSDLWAPATDGDICMADGGADVKTVLLPEITSATAGLLFTIKKTNAEANAVLVTPYSGDYIEAVQGTIAPAATSVTSIDAGGDTVTWVALEDLNDDGSNVWVQTDNDIQ